MGVYDRIKELAGQQKMSVAELERKLTLSNGIISKWNKVNPNSEPLAKVAKYFGVSVDYLLGLTNVPTLNSTDLPEYEENLLMMFRKGEQDIPEEKRGIYRKQAMDMMDFISKTMKDLDEKNKPK